jgi:flagellar biosynthetic protein FliR
MEQVYRFSEPEIIAFAMVMLRMSAFVATWPVFGVESVPAQVKILFALLVAFIVFPVIDWRTVQADFDSPVLIWLAVKEVFVGLVFGFLARMFFMAIRVAGEMISLSMGLSGAQMFNPSMGGQVTPVDTFFYSLAGLFFLAINGHHLFITGIVDSFRIIPLSPGGLSLATFSAIGPFVQEIISIGIRLSAPVIISILVVNLIMGILGKTVPQVNVLVTSLAVNIIVGFAVLIAALPMMMNEMPELLEISAARLFQIMRAL